MGLWAPTLTCISSVTTATCTEKVKPSSSFLEGHLRDPDNEMVPRWDPSFLAKDSSPDSRWVFKAIGFSLFDTGSRDICHKTPRSTPTPRSLPKPEISGHVYGVLGTSIKHTKDCCTKTGGCITLTSCYSFCSSWKALVLCQNCFCFFALEFWFTFKATGLRGCTGLH